MTALERVTAILERARVAGGWIDEDVATAVLLSLGVDEVHGKPIEASEPPTSSNIGHG